jgi:hypothetical protein
MRRYDLGSFADPAFACLLFAILLDLPILWHDVLGGQGDDFRAAWAHNDRGDDWVIIERVAVRQLSGEAVGAMDGLRRKVGGAIE